MTPRFSCGRLALLPLACFAAFPAFAQLTLPKTVVTATRVQQPVAEVVADITILDRDVIERSGAGGLADLLGRVPGVSFSRNGGAAATTSVYMRGAESRFTAVFVDGVRIDSQSTGGASWNAIPLSQIDRIEVVRGPAAAVYGSDALGGVIQIFTRKGEVGLSPSVELGVGSQGTRKLDASLSGAQGNVDYALGIYRETSQGFNVQPAGNPDKDGYHNTAASARLGWQLSRAQRLEATLLDSHVDTQYDAPASVSDDHARNDLQTLGLKWLANWSDIYSTEVGVSRGADRYETSPNAYLTDTRVSSYLWQNVWKLGQHRFTAALERREDRLENKSTTPPITDRTQNALSVGYGVRLGAHTLQLNARHDEDSEFGGQNTGGAAYSYAFTSNWRATASTGTAFRAPTLFQRFSIYGVPSLKPETARNLELGVKYEEHANRFSAVAYRNKVSDLITYVSGPGSCINGVGPLAGCYGNTASARYSGITLAGDTRLADVRLGASLDLQNPKDLGTGKQLARRARRMATLTADTRVAGWALGGEVQLVGDRFNDARNTQKLDGYSVLNLTARTALARDWTLLARVDNLADKTYETVKGYATAGRTVYVSLKWASQ
jgi:vitamin B12 transporter